ncbi:hypothetical protein CJ030_MR3G008403 [Morella rubra]|uniref:Agenet domain-containing protein n=1 Tax=Morella rubra TaxID=262757 RepID=A0A6A1W8L2_9ROSI|nr:hypothetical protein CJ030_MR3G008403 [Morella rubra]
MGHALEYVDFPDEKIEWIQLHQKRSKSKVRKWQLMVRPHFPPIYHESQMPDVNTISEVVVIVCDAWKVGNMVDWWADGCYWSARVTELLGDEKLMIELLPPPLGEGSSYEASSKDLRPSLDWTPENGWTVPIPVGNGSGCPCAWLIKPFNQGDLMVHIDDKGSKGVEAAARASLECSVSLSSHISASSLKSPDGLERMTKRPLSVIASKEIQTSGTNLELDTGTNGIGKTSCSDSVSSSQIRDASADMVGTTGGKGKTNNSESLKKMKADGSISLNSMSSDTVESAVVDLEELVNRIKRIRGLLEFGKRLPNTMQNPWKFLEHRASSSPK